MTCIVSGGHRSLCMVSAGYAGRGLIVDWEVYI